MRAVRTVEHAAVDRGWTGRDDQGVAGAARSDRRAVDVSLLEIVLSDLPARLRPAVERAPEHDAAPRPLCVWLNRRWGDLPAVPGSMTPNGSPHIADQVQDWAVEELWSRGERGSLARMPDAPGQPSAAPPRWRLAVPEDRRTHRRDRSAARLTWWVWCQASDSIAVLPMATKTVRSGWTVYESAGLPVARGESSRSGCGRGRARLADRKTTYKLDAKQVVAVREVLAWMVVRPDGAPADGRSRRHRHPQRRRAGPARVPRPAVSG